MATDLHPSSAPVLVWAALRDGPRSTRELRALGLSEPAVWQAVCRLRAAGHDVRHLRGRYELRSRHAIRVRLRSHQLELDPG